MIRLALDAMGGDHGIPVVVPAALAALQQHAELQIILVGDEAAINGDAQFSSADAEIIDRISIEATDEVVEMNELPHRALKNKKNSSMRRMLDLHANEQVDGCVSAGNTGALMAMARYVLKTLPGIDRPAMTSAIPAVNGHTHMLDLGANTQCTPEQLFQFGVMGSVAISAIYDMPSPRVGLLNIGVEDIKGSDVIRGAAQLLEESSINYTGFVEADGIFLSAADVIVCDGFSGNVALKSAEGLARMLRQHFSQALNQSLWSKLVGLVSAPILKGILQRVDPTANNGASFLGLNGVVIKSHGAADIPAFQNAIEIAVSEVQQAVPGKISRLLAETLGET